MLKKSFQVRYENNHELCIKCLYCKCCKDGKVKCSEGYFSDYLLKDVRLFTPCEFDCYNYEEV